jgi:protein-disulfide isomerase
VLRRNIILVSVGLILAGCSGEAPTIPGIAVSTVTTEANAAGAYDTGPVKNDEPVQSFGSIPDPSEGSRKVIENPSLADIMMTNPALSEMALGRATAPVTIVQYASLSCPHCREFHEKTFPEFKRTYIDTGKVRYILREFPIGKQSGNATVALRCAPPEKYFELYGKFMMQQTLWISQEVRLDPIYAVAKQVGMTRAQFDACFQNQAMIDALKWVKDRGRTLGVIGTPNFFVQGKLVKSALTMKDLRELVEAQLAAPASASASATVQR